MNKYVIAGEKLYPLRDKIISSKSGKKYLSRHVKITVATDYYSGKQIQHDYTGKNNYEVQSKIDESICLSDQQLNLIPNNITLEQLLNEYLDYKTDQITSTSLKVLKRFSELYIIPRLGNTLIKNIKKEDIINIQSEMKTITGTARCFYLMKASLDYACKKGYISCNPCKYTQIYQRVINQQPILNPDQIYKLLVEEKDNIYSGLYAILLFLALRFGEGLGLSWKQIDFEKRTVTISQQINEDHKLVYETKTKINRCLNAPECAFYYFERQKKFQALQKIHNPEWNNFHNLVFTDKNGNPLKRSVIYTNFKKIMSSTSNPNVTLHSLRRTTATILAEKVSMISAQYYLGHVSEGSSTKYIFPSSTDIEHLVSVMAEHFDKAFDSANLGEIYK